MPESRSVDMSSSNHFVDCQQGNASNANSVFIRTSNSGHDCEKKSYIPGNVNIAADRSSGHPSIHIAKSPNIQGHRSPIPGYHGGKSPIHRARSPLVGNAILPGDGKNIFISVDLADVARSPVRAGRGASCSLPHSRVPSTDDSRMAPVKGTSSSLPHSRVHSTDDDDTKFELPLLSGVSRYVFQFYSHQRKSQ